MKIDDIEAFVAVVRGQSLSQAAAELGLTQPAITRRIQSFEEDLGATLLDRNTKPPVPTELGLRVHAHCLDVLREIARLRASVDEAGAPGGPLRLGLTHGLGDALLPGLLASLANQHVAVAPRVTTGWGQALVERLGAGELDAALVYLPHGHVLPAGVTATRLGESRLRIVGRAADWPRRTYRLADFAEADWVLNPDGCGFRASLVRALAALGLPLAVRVESCDRALQRRCIAQGGGLGLAPDTLAAREAADDGLAVLPVSDFKPLLDLCLVVGDLPPRLRDPVAWLGAEAGRLLA